MLYATLFPPYGPLSRMSNGTHDTYTDTGITHVQHAGDDSGGWQQKPGVWQEAQVADAKPQSSYTQYIMSNYCTTGITNTYVTRNRVAEHSTAQQSRTAYQLQCYNSQCAHLKENHVTSHGISTNLLQFE